MHSVSSTSHLSLNHFQQSWRTKKIFTNEKLALRPATITNKYNCFHSILWQNITSIRMSNIKWNWMVTCDLMLSAAVLIRTALWSIKLSIFLIRHIVSPPEDEVRVLLWNTLWLPWTWLRNRRTHLVNNVSNFLITLPQFYTFSERDCHLTSLWRRIHLQRKSRLWSFLDSGSHLIG